MFEELKRGAAFALVSMLLFGGAYHALLLGVAAVAFPSQSEGSLLRRADGTVIGSHLIAQAFSRPEYFHPRPSGVSYNAASTGGTNLGPSNPDHLEAVRLQLEAVTTRERVPAGQVPAEMVTASGSGLDPHIPPGAALMQAARVALARGVPVERVEALVRVHTEAPVLGIFGRSRVNVLAVNLALDTTFGAPSTGR